MMSATQGIRMGMVFQGAKARGAPSGWQLAPEPSSTGRTSRLGCNIPQPDSQFRWECNVPERQQSRAVILREVSLHSASALAGAAQSVA